MTDLIDRQAAIDAMETWDKFGCDPDGKLVRYDDDKHYIPYVHYEDMVHAIKHLPSAQRWIPCSERLPDQNGKYLVVGRQKAINILKFDDGRWYGKWGVVAWMPLPSPYREEATDE